MNILNSIDLIIYTAGLMLCTISLVQAVNNRFIVSRIRTFCVVFFSIMDLYLLCLLTRNLTHHLSGHGWATFSWGMFLGQAILSSLLPVMVTVLILIQSGEERWYRRGAFRAAALIWVIYVAMHIYNQFNGFLYSVQDSNAYFRGAYFGLQMIPPILIMMINIVTLWRRWNRLSVRQRRACMVYIVVPTVCMVLQILVFGIQLITLGSVVAAVFMFRYIVGDQEEMYKKQEEENAQLKIDILMAQIRPHFLFNSLMTIRSLIGQDPGKAEEATTAFMKYLRHNIDSLTSDRMIAFGEELEQVKAYFEIQMLRFGDELNVEYDLQYTDFRMPTLTLIPLVENAISYGIRRNEDRSGTITIMSREYPDRIEVGVKDDGPGFVPDALPEDKEHAHIGISNVRERIERVSGGELIIDSEIGKGTNATIILPKKENSMQ